MTREGTPVSLRGHYALGHPVIGPRPLARTRSFTRRGGRMPHTHQRAWDQLSAQVVLEVAVARQGDEDPLRGREVGVHQRHARHDQEVRAVGQALERRLELGPYARSYHPGDDATGAQQREQRWNGARADMAGSERAGADRRCIGCVQSAPQGVEVSDREVAGDLRVPAGGVAVVRESADAGRSS